MENVKAVNGYFPLKYDGNKVRINSLRFKELKGFMCIQLKKGNIPYGEDENGRTTKEVTSLKGDSIEMESGSTSPWRCPTRHKCSLE